MIPNIKGIDKSGIIHAPELLDGKKCTGNKVLIGGGGFTGSVTADFLGEYGYDITIIDMLPDIAMGEQGSVRYFLMERLKNHGVNIITKATVKEFLDDGVVYEKNGREEKLTGFESIILAMGAKSYNPLEKKLKDKMKSLYVIGYARKARKALEAIDEGARLATEI